MPFQGGIENKKSFQVFDLELYTHLGYVSTLDGNTQLDSVKNWKCQGDEQISSTDFSSDVKEWWVWTIAEDLLYAGYAGQQAWVFNAQNKTIYSSSGGSKRLGKRKRGEWGSDDDIPQDHFRRCVYDQDYDLDESDHDSDDEPDESMEYGDDYDWDNHDYNKGFRCGSSWVSR